MADEVPSEPDPSNDSGASASDLEAESDDSHPVETLVAGKEKRATAGRRRTELTELEEDDELELLMQEDEDDEEFEGEDEDAGSDAVLSSDDDDDQGPNAGPDDLDGERELQQRAKAERAKKRKAMNALTTAAGVRKRVKIAPTPASGDKESVTKPSKKKERGSWLPDGKSGPSRTSTRWQTKANTKTTLLRVAKSAEESAKTRRRLQKLQREKEKDKPKELTQADRLAEAERTERKNAKSLNRWEAMEKKRAEEQAAKLAALKDRKLEGPVISSWSGAAQWLGPKLVKVGGKETNFEPAAEPKKRGRKPKGYWEAMDRRASLVAENSALGTPQETATPAPSEAAIDEGAPSEAAANASEAAPTPLTFTTPQNPDNFLNGIQELVPESSEPSPGLAPASNEAPQTSTQPVPPATNDPQYHPPLLLPPVSETSTRNLVILESFDKLTAQERIDYTFFYNHRKTPKPVKHAQELCPITSLPARYRDPSTGVPYANAYAYRKLQDLKKHQFIWSSMLGCFVGASGIVARGVPEEFSGM